MKLPYYELKRKILFEYLEKYKDIPSRTLARILVRDYSEYFKDVETARGQIRTYRGVSGKILRQQISSNQYFKDV